MQFVSGLLGFGFPCLLPGFGCAWLDGVPGIACLPADVGVCLGCAGLTSFALGG